MKKEINISNVGKLLYELQKLKKMDKYFSISSGGTKDMKSLLRAYGTLSVNIKAMAFYNKLYSYAGRNPFWWERTEYEGCLKRTDIISDHFNECLSRNKIVFEKITKRLCVSERKEIINILFALFPSDLVAVWGKDDDIFVNEIFLRNSIPDILENGFQKVFELQIEGENKLLEVFEKAERLKQKEHQERANSGYISCSRAGH